MFSVLAVLHLYDDGATSCADRILITELGLRLTDRSVWSQTANDIQPDVIQYYLLPVAPTNSSRLYHRSTIGLPITHWFLVPAALLSHVACQVWHRMACISTVTACTSWDAQGSHGGAASVVLRWMRLILSGVDASMVFLIISLIRKLFYPLVVKRGNWKSSMIIVIAISKHFSSDKSCTWAIFHCHIRLPVYHVYQNIIVFLKDDVMEIWWYIIT